VNEERPIKKQNNGGRKKTGFDQKLQVQGARSNDLENIVRNASNMEKQSPKCQKYTILANG
jgi:hypothetical protein